jgi:transitional endoplasmic reticulum ATPase
MQNFRDALAASRPTVTEEMEQEYRSIEAKIKQVASQPTSIGFVTPGMIKPIRDEKHGEVK